MTFASPRPIANPKLGIVVTATHGAPVFGFNTDMDPGFATGPLTAGTIEFTVADAPLHTGLYKITLWFGETAATMAKLDDAIAFHFVAPTSVPAGVSFEHIGHTRVQGRFRLVERDSEIGR